MSKSIAIIQSNYLPWKGYFDVVDQVDEFILFDEVQYTRRDWRNRNRIKTSNGVQWLTVPVQVKGKYHQRIDETRLRELKWVRTHMRTIELAYGKAPHFDAVWSALAPVFEGFVADDLDRLSLVNRRLLEAINQLVGITTTITWSTDYESADGRNERLISICRQASADVYISGPAARCYLDESMFEAAGIVVRWADYTGYPEYPQMHGPFEHAVTMLDLLFMVGPESAAHYMRTSGAESRMSGASA